MKMNETATIFSSPESHICSFEKQFFGGSFLPYVDTYSETILFLAVLAAILAPLNTLSNLLVLTAIIRTSALRKSTPNIFISSLAFADFLVGILYLPLYAAWSTTPWFVQDCMLYQVKCFMGWLVETASFNIILTICYERYIALFYSLRYLSILSTEKILFCLVYPWFIALTAALLFLLSFANLVLTCGVVCIGVGTVIIFFTYFRIFKLVRRHQHQIHAQTIGDSNNARQRKLAVTMAYVIGVSLVCYLPYLSGALSYVLYDGFTPQTICLFQFGEVLFAASSFINPFIYCVRNEEIKIAVLGVLRDITCK
ncbi:cannabinoid receptor 2-like [Actinia tenebrosa]|uniref:Cannabinoid receptor 2-like n=1 Tax=Actinia tenebrosa TaxID=6105 RepID=A0A6P8GZV2_ACTTE|nr:cannabinoid receptor 2-like [Actinia tenebrosa]